MAYCHVGHDTRVGSRCIMGNGTLLAGHVEMQDQVVMGGSTAVHQFCRIGRLAIQSGGTVVVQDIPPFCMVCDSRSVAALNLVGLRRANLRPHIKNLEAAFGIIFLQRRAMNNALPLVEKELSHDPLVLEMVRFIQGSKRGTTLHIIRARRAWVPD